MWVYKQYFPTDINFIHQLIQSSKLVVFWEDAKPFQWIEFFAGKAEATRAFRESGFQTGRLDINYMRPGKSGMNPMDLCSDLGFAFLGRKPCVL